MFEAQRKGETFKYLTFGTIINTIQVLKLSFKAPVEEFDLYLPAFQHMIDSLKFGQFENNSNHTESTAITNTNQAIKIIFEKGPVKLRKLYD
jgi:hypothetical protein